MNCHNMSGAIAASGTSNQEGGYLPDFRDVKDGMGKLSTYICMYLSIFNTTQNMEPKTAIH